MKAKNCLVLVMMALIFFGCGDDDGGTTDIQPTTGLWDFNAGDIFDDDCEFTDPPADPDGVFSLTNNGDGTLSIDTDGAEPFECTLNGADFTCPSRLQEEISETGVDAVVTVNVNAQGTFDSNEAASGYQTAEFTCTGADCTDVEAQYNVSFPCSYSQYFSAVLTD